MPRSTNIPGPSSKRKAVTIEISSDDDVPIDELVSGQGRKTTVKKPELKRPSVPRRSTAGSAGGFGGFVSAFDSHGSRDGRSVESGPSRGLQPPRVPQLDNSVKVTATVKSTASGRSAKPKLRLRDAGEEPIVMDVDSSPKSADDDALTWAPSDSEIELVSATIASRPNGKPITKPNVGPLGLERGTKRTRQGDKKMYENWGPDIDNPESSSMWTDEYAPTTIADLAPSKNRINQVKAWLEEALYGRPAGLEATITFSKQAAERVKKYRRILLLTGPAGVGKSTSVRVIAAEMGVEVVEWNEGFEEWGLRGDVERESLTSKLITFLSRNSYSPLSITEASRTHKSHSNDIGSTATISSSYPPPRLLLITSLPNLSHYPTRQAFHSALIDYSKTHSSNSCPLIVVIPDVGQSGAAEEPWSNRAGGASSSDASWDLKSVVGETILASPAVTTVDFLPMAPTFIGKALKRLITLAIPAPSDRPSNDIVQLIAQSSNGDLRSAVNSLEMLMKTSSGSLPTSTTSKSALPKKGKGSRGGGKTKTSGSKEMQTLQVGLVLDHSARLLIVCLYRLNQIARREQSLGLFHALGKVLYNKRKSGTCHCLGDTTEDGDDSRAAKALEEEYMKTNPLPAHLIRHARPRYENDFEALLNAAPLDTASFMLWMHQNMPQFCADIGELDHCIEAICDADSMKTDDDLWQRSSQAIAYAFHVAVRGVVAGLPSPVPKNQQKMFKPDFFRWIKAGKTNQETLAETSRWLARSGESSRHEDNLVDLRGTATNADADSYTYRGQRSNAVLATEYLPMMRLLRRHGHNVPLGTDYEPFTSLNDSTNDLDVLGEKDCGADISIGHETNETIETISTVATSGRMPTVEAISDDESTLPTAGSYLQDDDIEDDD